MNYSIVVPIYNDGYLAAPLSEEIERVFLPLAGDVPLAEVVELIFINDGSRDDSIEQLLALRGRFGFVRVIDLSRNYGQHIAIACGFREAIGNTVIRMNVDMQDPPSEIPKLIAEMEKGDYDLVVGQYAERKSPLRNRLSSWVYFVIFKFLSGIEVPHNTSPLRLMSRRFIDAYNTLTEKSRFPQGLDYWLGFRHKYVPIEHRERNDKKSSYTFLLRLKLAMNGILYFSDRPLKIVALSGFALALVGLLLGIYIVVNKLFGAEYLPGFASLASVALIAFGVQLGSIGLLGLYIGKIFVEVQNRPLYLIRDNFHQLRKAE